MVKKGKPFYHIVTADSRAKRDGRYIERIGSYNPNTNPATIDVNFEEPFIGVALVLNQLTQLEQCYPTEEFYTKTTY